MSISSRFTAAFESELIKTAFQADRYPMNAKRALGGSALGAAIGAALEDSYGGLPPGYGAIFGGAVGIMPETMYNMTRSLAAHDDEIAQEEGLERSSRPKSALKGGLIGAALAPLLTLAAHKFGSDPLPEDQLPTALKVMSLFGGASGSAIGAISPTLVGSNKKHIAERALDTFLPYSMRRIVRRD